MICAERWENSRGASMTEAELFGVTTAPARHRGRHKCRHGDPPTARQLHVLLYCWRRCLQGWPPTYREIAVACYPACQVETGRQSARQCLYWLSRKGLLTITPRIARGLQLTEAGLLACEQAAGR